MLKRIVMLIMLGTLFSSCVGLYLKQVKQSLLEAEMEKYNRRHHYTKDGDWAYQVHKEVNNVMKEMLKRPINKEVYFKEGQFKEIKILIPENTKLNSKMDNIVDMKTGYGLPIFFYIRDYCDDDLSDKVKSKKKFAGAYYHIGHHSETKETKALFEKISKVNGFTDGGCK